jgi:hypothetical protein
MAPAFKSERPLTRSQYAQRRDQTTVEEVKKLKSTPEFKKFAKTKGIIQVQEHSVNNKHLTLSAVIAIVVTILLAATLPGKVSPNETILGIVQPTTSGPESDSLLEQQREVQPEGQSTVDLEYSVIELTSHLKTTELELYSAQRENTDLKKALEKLERSVDNTTTCSSITPISTTTTNTATSVGDTLRWVVLGCISLIISIAASVRIAKQRLVTESTMLRSENLDLTAQLQELAFEKEMAEQSISILEGELQRKMSQLAEAQYKTKPATPIQASGPENGAVGSPRIRAVQKTAASPTPLSLAGTSPLLHNGLLQNQRTPDSLPPPPRQLVERFLEERGAIAIEQEQVQAWLEMEGLFGKLQREVATLRAVVEGKDGESVEQQRRIEELNQALEEQKKASRLAKDALKAVRSVATGN